MRCDVCMMMITKFDDFTDGDDETISFETYKNTCVVSIIKIDFRPTFIVE